MVVGQDMQDMGLQNWTVYRYIKVTDGFHFGTFHSTIGSSQYTMPSTDWR